MKKLAGEICEAIVIEYGGDEFLKRMADSFFFQSLGCVIGFDWHSSGITTTTAAAIKEGINNRDIGIKVCGGKGATSRKTPSEIEERGSEFGLSIEKTEKLKYNSRMVAKVDNNVLQDGYQLYAHSFFLAEKGKWAVVQQGMNNSNSYARRYHWLSEAVSDFVNEPHTCISCNRKEENVLNMTAAENDVARKISVDLVNDNPQHLKKYFGDSHLQKHQLPQQLLLTEFNGVNWNGVETLSMPKHEPIMSCDLTERTLKQLQTAYEIQPENYEELVSLRGIGAKSVRALALISELIYGCRLSWNDSSKVVKFSFAHGGKDGYPYPIDRKHYDKSIEVLTAAVEEAKINKEERLKALRKLSMLIANG